ncbi:YceI family protein [Oryzibacter oryziterrae]|uniref:YceI family protein n=1 Tax=Oryzibacter oryziterrae TaxID=2766474 RepID=UPI001F397561|nr:YceI family protein [Oryzibacter oryziterrae]
MRLSLGIFVAAGMMSLAAARADDLSEAAGHYTIDPASEINFNVGQVGGGGISGKFPDFTGSMDLDAHDLGHSRVAFVLKPASLTTGQDRIDGFLRSSAVFDASEYPDVVFRSASVERTGTDTARIVGAITARGITYKATFDAHLDRKSGRALSFTVTGQVPRLPFGMGIGVPIYDNMVAFNMTLVAKRG